jgi:hypothetical protein
MSPLAFVFAFVDGVTDHLSIIKSFGYVTLSEGSSSKQYAQTCYP